MLTYKSSLSSAPPYTPAMAEDAARSLSGKSPYKQYRGNAADVFRSVGNPALANVDATGAAANAAYAARFNDAQRQLALSGLNFMSDSQKGAQDVANARLSGVNSLLGGLFS